MVTLAAHLALTRFTLFIGRRLVGGHNYVFQIDIIIHVVKSSLSLVPWLVELSEHVEFIVDVLG
jgi:hypothetical protein